jgi:hypothetical protein
MKKVLIILLLILPLSASATIDFDYLSDFWSSSISYPEEYKRTIKVKKEKSSLDSKNIFPSELEEIQNLVETPIDLINNNLFKEAISELGFNKFYLGSGLIDVTFQVKNGVSYALQETFNRYPEYQRRKICEEIINSNFQAHKLSANFLQGHKSLSEKYSWKDVFFGFSKSIFEGDFSDFQNSLEFNSGTFIDLLWRLSKNKKFKELGEFFILISKFSVFLFLSLAILRRLGSFTNPEKYSDLLLRALFVFLGLNLITPILNLFILVFRDINTMLLHELNFGFFDSQGQEEALKNNWTQLANGIGYMPAMILSIIDTIAQFVSYLFFSSIILYLLVSKIISPFFFLGFGTYRFRVLSIIFFLNWIKTLGILSLMPLIYASLDLISSEFLDLSNPMLNISLSISSLMMPPIFGVLLFLNSNKIGSQRS